MSANEPTPGAPAAPAAPPPHILVVDDEPLVAEFFKRALAAEGYAVTCVLTAAAALERQAQTRFDAAIVDIGLPDMNGIELMRRMRAASGEHVLPLLAITSRSAPAMRVAAAEAGATGVIGKPVRAGTLRALVRLLLRIAEHQRASVQTITRLEEMGRYRTLLAQMIVHDLSNLLTGLLGRLDFIGLGPLTPEQARQLDEAGGVSREIKLLAHDFIDIDRLQEARLPLNRRPVRVESVLRHIVDEIRTVAGDTKDIRFDPPPPLTPVNADEEILRRIIRNLLTNGLQHGGDRIWVAAAAPGGAVEVTIEDEGTGIPADAREKIFEKFGMAALRTGGYRRGRGLGLAFSRLAARAHGGDVFVEDRPSGLSGARFVFRVPFEGVPGGGAPPPPPPSAHAQPGDASASR